MLKLAEIIREGLKIKRAKKVEPRKVEVSPEQLKAEVLEEKLKAQPESLPVSQPEIKGQPIPTTTAQATAPAPPRMPPSAPAAPLSPPTPSGEATAEVKEEVEAESAMSLIEKEIEALELDVDEENKVYRIGHLATLEFKDFVGCNPVIAAVKIKEAAKETLLKKYQVKPDELEKKLDELKKKFRTFGTHCYIRTIKQEM